MHLRKVWVSQRDFREIPSHSATCVKISCSKFRKNPIKDIVADTK
jgi:hypothetical protein